MKAITISQPYASLIATGDKVVENRTWATKHLGPLAIHAGLGTQYMTRQQLRAVTTSAVLCVVDVVGCLPISVIRHQALSQPGSTVPEMSMTWSDLFRHVHTEGPVCWLLSNLRRYTEPIPQTGARGLWTWHEPDCVQYID